MAPPNNNMWKIKRIVKKGDYNYAVVPEHPKAIKFGYVLHHRVVMENKIGRLLKDYEVVHHINEIKKDNRPENLVIMYNAEHCRHHASTGRAMMNLICPYCDKQFIREANQVMYKGSKRSFCSKSCSAKFYR